MFAAAFKQNSRRRLPAGPAFALVATLGVLAAAWPSADRITVPVSYELTGSDAVVRTSGQRFALSDSPDTLAPIDDIRAQLRRFATTGDARYLRYAEVSLEPWLRESAPGVEVLSLKARIQQSKHEFDAAGETLAAALRQEPRAAGEWLLYADVLRRAGKLADARSACLRLGLSGQPALAQYCAVQVLLTAGENDRAYQIASSLRTRGAALPGGAGAWALELTAEAAAATGRVQEAIAFYEQALADEPSPLASRLAYADLLFDNSDFAAVLDTLGSDMHSVAAQVRLVAAQQALGTAIDPAIDDSLANKFAAVAPTSNDALLFRDRALYELTYRNDPQQALAFALANWEEQKSYEDLRLLRDAATAAGNQRVLDDLVQWQQSALTGAGS